MPRKPPSPCTWPQGCTALVDSGTRCPAHARPAWAGSNRRARLPKDWPATRLRILRRDHGICHVCGKPGADAVDHIVPGDDHRDSNLAAIHTHPCHATKSAREGQAARLDRGHH